MQLKGSRQTHTDAISNIAEPESDTSGKHAKDAFYDKASNPSSRHAPTAADAAPARRVKPSGQRLKRAAAPQKGRCRTIKGVQRSYFIPFLFGNSPFFLIFVG